MPLPLPNVRAIAADFLSIFGRNVISFFSASSIRAALAAAATTAGLSGAVALPNPGANKWAMGPPVVTRVST